MGRWRRRYVVLSAALVVGVLTQSINRQWSTDMALHAGAVRALAANPIDPVNPLVDSQTPHTVYSPYTLIVGIVDRTTGLSTDAALTLAGTVAAAFVCAALWWFVVELTDDERAPFWSLLCSLLLVGPLAYRWSGFLHLNAIGFVAPYPATAAVAGALAGLALTCRALARPHDVLRWALAPVVAWTIVVHPPTATWMAMGIGAIVLARWAAERDRTARRIVGPVAVGVGLTLAWPYWRWPSTLGVFGDYQNVSAILYEHPVLTLGVPVALGVAALINRVGSTRLLVRDAAAWMLLFSVLTYGLGAVFDVHQAGRVLPLVLLVTAIEVGRWFTRMEAARRTATVVVAASVLVVGGVVVSRAGVIRMVPSALLPARVTESSEWEPTVDRYAWVAEELDEGSVIVSNARAPGLTFLGFRRLDPVWEPNLLDDVDDRRAARLEVLSINLPPDRRTDVLEAWSIDAALVGSDEHDLLSELRAVGGREVRAQDGQVLVVFTS